MNTIEFTCPCCGQQLTVTGQGRGGLPGLSRGGMLRYEQDVTMAVGWPGQTWPGQTDPGPDWRETETPARQPTREGDVTVPALQAVISGAFVGALGGGLALGVTVAAHWPWYVPPVTGLAVGLLTASERWFGLLDDTRRLLRRIETWGTPSPVHGGTPARETPTLRVELADNPGGTPGQLSAGERMAWFELPCTEGQARAVAKAVLAGTRKLTRRDLAGVGGLSDQKARELLTALEQAGMTRGRGHDPAGAELTPAGRAMFKQLAGD